MKVKTLLKQASRCHSDEDCRALLSTMVGEFFEKGPLRHLGRMNDEACMEGDDPNVRLEINKLVSDHYAIVICPEIRGRQLSVEVRLNRLLDGLGMGSQRWEIADEDVIEADDPDRTITDLCKRAKELAVMMHQRLIEAAGVPCSLAADVARKRF